jgi:hypothetical protein
MMMMSRRISTQTERLLAATYRLGRQMALREMADAIAERDRSIAGLRAEFDREAGELRGLLKALTEKLWHLQKLDAAMRATPPRLLH